VVMVVMMATSLPDGRAGQAPGGCLGRCPSPVLVVD
jgi:hypothetical protein